MTEVPSNQRLSLHDALLAYLRSEFPLADVREGNLPRPAYGFEYDIQWKPGFGVGSALKAFAAAWRALQVETTTQSDLLQKCLMLLTMTSRHTVGWQAERDFLVPLLRAALASPQKATAQCSDPEHSDFQRNAPWIAGGDF